MEGKGFAFPGLSHSIWQPRSKAGSAWAHRQDQQPGAPQCPGLHVGHPMPSLPCSHPAAALLHCASVPGPSVGGSAGRGEGSGLLDLSPAI